MKLSEYQSKRLFYLNTDYFVDYINLNKLDIDPEKRYVIKVDNGSKGRMKAGLVKLNITGSECIEWVKTRNILDNYIVEYPIQYIEREIYVMIRPYTDPDYDQIIINENGGINLTDPLQGSREILVECDTIYNNNSTLLDQFIRRAYNFYSKYHLTYLEMNPVIINSFGQYIPADFAVLWDSDSSSLFSGVELEILTKDYFHESKNLTTEEQNIKLLDTRTGGSLKFTLLNPEGSIWTLIAGGGASVLFTDAIYSQGYISELANYGEYSGDPQSDLVEEYCDNIFSLMSTKCKKLFIGGGIANFTDVSATFSGIIKSIDKNYQYLKDTDVWIRRGGPNYERGLELMRNTLSKYNISCHIYGPETPITEIVRLALPPKDKPVYNINNLEPNLKHTKTYIPINFNRDTKCVVYGFNKKAIERMLDFDYICNKTTPSVVAVCEPLSSKDRLEPIFFGNKSILLNIHRDIEFIAKKYVFDTVINFSSFRTAYKSTLELLEYSCIKNIVIIAEGVPERHSRILKKIATKKMVNIFGPATVGGIVAGEFKIANTGGTIENIISCGLNTSGSIGLVTRSGGLLNEMCNLIGNIHTSISIGGDRYPCQSFYTVVKGYQENSSIEKIVILGEIGGVEELVVAEAVKNGEITKPVIAWCYGISANYFNSEIKFGHAGASANSEIETAIFKNYYMSQCGIAVPTSFEDLKKLVNTIKITSTPTNKINSNRRLPTFFSSISNELGDILTYNGVPITNLLTSGIGKTIGHLWLKLDLPDWICKFIELVLIVCADHGAMVSGAHNTIVASRAGKDMISSLCSGLLTIGDLFGGALNDSAKQFKYALDNGLNPEQFVEYIKSTGKPIMGIGHKLKTAENPDMRVKVLLKYIYTNFPEFRYVNYALEVERITLRKRNNLILNVDGLVANALLDCFSSVMLPEELTELVDNQMFNSFFVLARTIGFIGHWHDQRRLKQGLFRLDDNDIEYLT
jgi:ATP citrate (pro-S)-lyase